MKSSLFDTLTTFWNARRPLGTRRSSTGRIAQDRGSRRYHLPLRGESLEARCLLAADPYSFAVIGDYGIGNENSAAVASMINGWDPDFIITLGDNNYRSLKPGERGWSWAVGDLYGDFILGRSDNKYPEQTSTEQRFFPSVGNHDSANDNGFNGGSGGSLEGYLDYFYTDPAGGRLPDDGLQAIDQSYYSFQWEDARFFSLDSDHARLSSESLEAQQAWLKQGLADSTASWNFVFMHHSPFSSGLHGDDPLLQWPYAEWGADVVFGAHDHTYERIEREGITYIVNGLGGQSPYSFGDPVDGSQVMLNDDWGSLRVSIEDTLATFEFLSLDDGANGANGGTVVDTFVIDRIETDLRITEVMHSPAELGAGIVDPDNLGDYEFVELTNVGVQTLNLSNVRFTEGIDFDFGAAGSPFLEPGEQIVVVKDTDAFKTVYGTTPRIAGEFSGRLDGGGEIITLELAGVGTIQSFEYKTGDAWPQRARGRGSSLEVIDTSADYSDADNWRSSIAAGGTPGSAKLDDLQDVVINEVLSHTDLPQTDAFELHNQSSAAIDVSGWFVSDSNEQYKKFRIPSGTIIPSGGYLVFDETDFNSSQGVDPNDFRFNGAHGEGIWLVAANSNGRFTRFVDRVKFGATANGVSLGRWPNGTGELFPMDQLSLGSRNMGPRVGDLIISELNYNPAMFFANFSGEGVSGLASTITGQEGEWEIVDGRYRGTPLELGDTAALAELNGPLPENFVIETKVSSLPAVGGFFSGAAIIFDYKSETDFKFAGAFFGNRTARIGRRSGANWITDSQLSVPITSGADYEIKLVAEPDRAWLFIDGEEVAFALYDGQQLNEGRVGVGSNRAIAMFDNYTVRQANAEDFEFIELYNTTDGPLDASGYLLDGAVDFLIPEETVVPAGGTIVIVAFHPEDPSNADKLAQFRAVYEIDESVILLGPYDGKLANEGEVLTLAWPDEPPAEEPGFIPFILLDRVDYNDKGDWPREADGRGASISRRSAAAYGDFPQSWNATLPSPGSVTIVDVGDSPPTVVDVTVSGTDWSASVIDYLETFGLGKQGFSLANDRPLPWSNIDRLSVQFSKDVDVRADDLTLAGVRVEDYLALIGLADGGFEYDSNTLTATWTLDGNLVWDQITLGISDRVTSIDGSGRLDGEWPGAAGSLPSGDLNNGGSLEFQLAILPGDFNRNGIVDLRDVQAFRSAILASPGDSQYSPYLDFDANGSIDMGELVTLRNHLLKRALPVAGDGEVAPRWATEGSLAELTTAAPLAESYESANARRAQSSSRATALQAHDWAAGVDSLLSDSPGLFD